MFPALNSTISSNPTANMSGGQFSSSVDKGIKSYKNYYLIVSSNDLFSNVSEIIPGDLSCVFPAKLINIHYSSNLISWNNPCSSSQLFSCLSPTSWSPTLSQKAVQSHHYKHYTAAVLRWKSIQYSPSLTPKILRTQHLTTCHFFHPLSAQLAYPFPFIYLFFSPSPSELTVYTQSLYTVPSPTVYLVNLSATLWKTSKSLSS